MRAAYPLVDDIVSHWAQWRDGVPSTQPAATTDNGRGRLIDANGSKLYVETQGSGAPVLFLHGGIMYFDTAFAAQRDYFASSRQVIGIDQRGHGHSPDDARPFDYRQMADDTAAVLRRLGVGPVDVIGHSDGGDVALLLARHHPESVRRVVVSGANLRAGRSPEELALRSHWTPEQFDAAALKMSLSLPPSFHPDYLKVTPEPPGHWQTLLTKSYRLWLTPVVIEPADLKLITAPVLVVSGDHDFTDFEETLEIFRALPHAQLAVLPDTGHGTMNARPERINAIMNEFLSAP